MIWIDGVESRFLNYKDLRRRHVAYIPQQLFKSNITVEQFLCNLGVNLENIKLDMSEEDYIFLKSVYSKRLSNLSGGQLQKVNILGRVFPMKTVIIFDEPTAFLDNDGKEWFYLLLKRIKKKSISIVICHDDYLDNLVDGVIDMGNVNGAIEGDSDNGD
jgi:ABC-type lipoprotein export system ATPase subunit